MSQQAVERTIGKLATDAGFRDRFFANPAGAAWETGLVLSPVELQALSALSRAAITRFSECLGPRLRRLCIDATTAGQPAERVPGGSREGE